MVLVTTAVLLRSRVLGNSQARFWTGGWQGDLSLDPTESPHGHLKNRIEQAIYLRGSNDFKSLEEYRLLIEGVVAKLNQQCQAKFEEEKFHLQPLPKYRVPDYEMLTARVSSRSTVEVRCVLYTVPSRLIGRQLELRLYHDRILGYLGNHQVVDLPRVRVTDPDVTRHSYWRLTTAIDPA
jgi:hypothetical protein